MQKMRFVISLFILAGVCARVQADALTDKLDELSSNLVQQFSVPIQHWRFSRIVLDGVEQPDFDDSDWQAVETGFSWPGENTKVWFRSTVTIPETVNGEPTAGFPVRLELGMDDDGEIYLNGQLKEAFHWDEGRYTLMQQAKPGTIFHLAVRGINGPGSGQLHFARLSFEVLPELDQYLNEAKFVGMLKPVVSADEQGTLSNALAASEAEIHFTEITPANLEAVRDQIKRAQADLAPMAAITRKYDVHYIGHAHIDMNWLWTWPETIDTCRRTWNSAMNLMDEFPEFRFVQSQPGAYVPIEQQYPDEFKRMQAKAAEGQWDPVGGLWNESDTDIPSGEGLAQSFLLGQTFFKDHFGKYAATGWLPDSFGHTWQLPQIMSLSGIQYYYHMRCGNGMPFTWWEAPDGSRVLKANTENYDDTPQLSQLAEPVSNQTHYNLPQSLIVFGVGDHGGGPTREQIIHIQSFEHDPLLPKVHFDSADTFFGQLATNPAAASLPVVDWSLQYTLEGCYTTHADLKKAIRQGENRLYSAEVVSSLATMLGKPYPMNDFRDAWKPTAFAQFHDIACGSAIHSTYGWMLDQLAPAVAFEKKQTADSLDFLASTVDTRGPGDQPIVVWNTLGFTRDDVVKISLPGADQFHSVMDAHGRRYPAQVMDGTNLVFVARGLPAFGYAVYFPQKKNAAAEIKKPTDLDYAYSVDTPIFKLEVSKDSGAITKLLSKAADWNAMGDSYSGNLFQLLGDSGNAWLLQYTGKKKLLNENTKVSVVDAGPVFDRVRVVHQAGKSTFTQDLIAYGALPRIDVPTTIDWQEEHQTLKLQWPVNATHPEMSAQIPFASTVYPMTSQECPGQKWMDVSQTVPQPVKNPTPLDISTLFNAQRTENFDGGGYAYPTTNLPAAGTIRLGFNRVPFRLPAAGGTDCVSAAGQILPLPVGLEGNTLYLLAACVNGSRWTQMGFQLSNTTLENRAFPLNDWVVNAYETDDAIGFTSMTRHSSGGSDAVPLHMWIVKVPLPKGATALVLPHDSNVRLFAATVGTDVLPQSVHGLSILNDGKNGCDMTNNVFRLTTLRSSSEPDPHPDQGLQQFTYSLYPHANGWRAAHTDEQALALNVPLLATVTTPHAGTGTIPTVAVKNVGGAGDLIVTALRRSEDGRGYILRFYEADGQDTMAEVDFGRVMQAEQTDILQRPLANQTLMTQGSQTTLPVGHNQIVTLHFWPDTQQSATRTSDINSI